MTSSPGDDPEVLALAAVQGRLRERFPDLDPAVVEAAVRVSHAELKGPIRGFVPLLVERRARDRLSPLDVDFVQDSRSAGR